MAATYTVKQVADILGYSTNSIYTFLKEKRIRGVRVGKGRFRVPQGELDRLLTNAPSAKSAARSPASAVQSGAMTPVSGQYPAAALLSPVTAPLRFLTNAVSMEPKGERRVEVPSYFEWFMGLASIILGASLSIFAKTFEDMITGTFIAMRPAIQMTMIAGGVGLLLTDMRGMAQSLWHKLFYGLVVGAYLGLVLLLVQMGDADGALFFGGVGVVGVVGWIVGIGGVGRVTLYVLWILGVAGPVSLVYLSDDIHIAPWIENFSFFGPHGPEVVAGLSAASAVLLGAAYLKHLDKLFRVLIVIVGLVLNLFAFWFASENYWNRSLFVKLTGFFCLLIPVWVGHSFARQHERRTAFGLFGAVFALYMIAIAVIYVFQLNMMEYAKGEIERKLVYARILVESTLEQSQASVEGIAQNPTVIGAIGKKDADTLAGIARSFFDGNTALRRLFFVDADGDILFYYPLANTPAISNAAFREYFTVPTTTKKTYISDLFEIRAEIPLKVITISAPVLGAGGRGIGVVVGSVDLSRMGGRLQEITSDDVGEYVTIVDAHGKRIIHPDPALVGMSPDPGDAILQALKGASGVGEGATRDGDRALTAYAPVGPYGWGMGIKMPLRVVLATTRAASVVIVALLSLSVFCIGLYAAVRVFGQIRIAGNGEEPDGGEPKGGHRSDDYGKGSTRHRIRKTMQEEEGAPVPTDTS